MSKPKRPTAADKGPRRDPLASLKLADLLISKPVLPAEVLATVVDFLDVPDLLCFARTSHKMQEMVYDDARWVRRLRAMSCWDEGEAQKRADAAHAQGPRGRRRSTIDRNIVNGRGRPEVLFDGALSPLPKSPPAGVFSPLRAAPAPAAADGFDAVELARPGKAAAMPTPSSHDAALAVFQRVRSIRGQARREYGKIYAALAPYYRSLAPAADPLDSRIFHDFQTPEKQAQVLSNLHRFAASDFSPAAGDRRRRIQDAIDRLDAIALLEFRQGYEYKDIQGRMRQSARVMHTLNGGKTAVDLFLHDNNLVGRKAELGTVADCIDYSLGHGQLSLEKVRAYFERLGQAFTRENAIVHTVFPDADKVSIRLLEQVAQHILAPFLTGLFDDARTRATSLYLRIVSGSFAATEQFIVEYAIPRDADDTTRARCHAVIGDVFEPHLDAYLAEELAFFQRKAEAEIEHWDRALSEQAASTEDFLMSNVNRQADKKDFLTSFKKVVMMPVNILPSFSASASAPAPSKTAAAKALVNGDCALPSRAATPNPLARTGTPSLPTEAPTSELAAKAALMNTKLENIRSLFSLEVALNLVHAAKSSLERAVQFVVIDGAAGAAARQQCSAIFVFLLQTVGVRHVKTGFDKAIDHLSQYRPHEVGGDSELGAAVQVAPLAIFLELVNVGDLIQQMIDVFYESELVRLGISNRDDFLDVNVKEKKKFEAALDERVAAGLGKGIDVLMDEVEFICATTQRPTDFYPELAASHHGGAAKRDARVVDFSGQPTATAARVIGLVSLHTSMLTGATEKTLLDVFTAEVGLRLFAALTKHIKRQRVSTSGALALISDLTAYAQFIAQFKNHDLSSYYTALREVAQIYLIGGDADREVAEMATIISDGERYKGIFTVEEVVEFAERRSDWLAVRSRVERKVSGENCVLM